jgi:uncharacterized protein GlcG (DUF336 family)
VRLRDSRRALALGGLLALVVLVTGSLAWRDAQHVQAQTPPASTARQTITLAGAHALITAAEAKAAEIGVPMVVVVVDESGVLKAYDRMDGAALLSVGLAQDKAYTAVAFSTPTDALAGLASSDPALLASLAAVPHVSLIGGGYPVKLGDAVIGALGVSGGLPAQDMQVAQAGLTGLK